MKCNRLRMVDKYFSNAHASGHAIAAGRFAFAYTKAVLESRPSQKPFVFIPVNSDTCPLSPRCCNSSIPSLLHTRKLIIPVLNSLVTSFYSSAATCNMLLQRAGVNVYRK